MTPSFQDHLVLGGRWVPQDQKGTEEIQARCLSTDQHLVNLENLGNQALKDSKESLGFQVAKNKCDILNLYLIVTMDWDFKM